MLLCVPLATCHAAASSVQPAIPSCCLFLSVFCSCSFRRHTQHAFPRRCARLQLLSAHAAVAAAHAPDNPASHGRGAEASIVVARDNRWPSFKTARNASRCLSRGPPALERGTQGRRSQRCHTGRSWCRRCYGTWLLQAPPSTWIQGRAAPRSRVSRACRMPSGVHVGAAAPFGSGGSHSPCEDDVPDDVPAAQSSLLTGAARADARVRVAADARPLGVAHLAGLDDWPLSANARGRLGEH